MSENFRIVGPMSTWLLSDSLRLEMVGELTVFYLITASTVWLVSGVLRACPLTESLPKAPADNTASQLTRPSTELLAKPVLTEGISCPGPIYTSMLEEDNKKWW